MDPNAALQELLAIAGAAERDPDRMAELVEALDGWLRGGGFLPARWSR
jgi:alkyl hydroperoxide reductase subunit AhpC